MECHWRDRVDAGMMSCCSGALRAGTEIRERAAMLPVEVSSWGWEGKGSRRDVPESQAAPVRPIDWAMRTEIGKTAMMDNVWTIS